MPVQIDQRLRLYLTHRAALVDYAAPIVGCRATAEDVVQEAFVRFAGEPTVVEVNHVSQPVGYLYRIVRNLAVDWARRLSAQAYSNQPAPDSVVSAVPAGTPTPEEHAAYREELAIVATALDELPERTRLVFEMHRLEGLTLKEVAQQMGISITLTHQLVRRAMTHCADRLDSHMV